MGDTEVRSIKAFKLQSDQGAVLIDVVDQLRDLGTISHELPLPQIIVVGDQSSGKSSVLEAISGLSFPTSQGVCTQFSTEVSLRRSRAESTTVSIKSKNPSRRSQVEAFAVRWKDADLQSLPKIVGEAKDIMGLTEEIRFSEDVLKIEICGPDKDHLTLIDLPGLFQTKELNQSSSDRELVRDLISWYAGQPRTIILAVVAANTDYQNQGILDLLQKLDEGGKRTLGVVTMPDVLFDGSPRFLTYKALIDNRKWPTRLGWHVVRNPNFDERAKKRDRKTIEHDFFDNTPEWRDVPAINRGTGSLRQRLSQVLKEHISTELPAILAEINSAITRCEVELKSLGEGRDTSDKQKLYLVGISREFEQLMMRALEGEYKHAYFAEPKHRLRALIMDANDCFANAMVEKGHKWLLLPHAKDSLVPTPAFHFVQHPSGCKIPVPEITTQEKMLSKVQVMQQSYRGTELCGLPQSGLVGKLFREQSQKWRTGVESHVEHVSNLVKYFAEELLIHVAGRETSARILRDFIDPAFEMRATLIEQKIEEILKPYLDGHPLTLSARFSTGSRAMADSSTKVYGEEGTCEVVLNSMTSYYNIALDVVMDNTAMLVIEQCLLQDLEKLVSTEVMLQQTPDKLQDLAGESNSTASRRRTLKQTLQEYQQARALIRSHTSRPLRALQEETEKPALFQMTSSNLAAAPDLAVRKSPGPGPRNRAKSPALGHSVKSTTFSSVALPPDVQPDTSWAPANVSERADPPTVSKDSVKVAPIPGVPQATPTASTSFFGGNASALRVASSNGTHSLSGSAWPFGASAPVTSGAKPSVPKDSTSGSLFSKPQPTPSKDVPGSQSTFSFGNHGLPVTQSQASALTTQPQRSVWYGANAEKDRRIFQPSGSLTAFESLQGCVISDSRPYSRYVSESPVLGRTWGSPSVDVWTGHGNKVDRLLVAHEWFHGGKLVTSFEEQRLQNWNFMHRPEAKQALAYLYQVQGLVPWQTYIAWFDRLNQLVYTHRSSFGNASA